MTYIALMSWTVDGRGRIENISNYYEEFLARGAVLPLSFITPCPCVELCQCSRSFDGVTLYRLITRLSYKI